MFLRIGVFKTYCFINFLMDNLHGRKYTKVLEKNLFDITWSPTRFKIAETCERQYYYNYLTYPKPIAPIFPDMAFGIFTHIMFEKFFRPFDYKDPEKAGKPKYKSAKTFTNAFFGEWKRRIHAPKKEGGFGPVRWKDKDEPYSRWGTIIRDLGPTIYERYVKEGPALFVELTLPVLLIDGIKLFVKMDEIRSKLIVRDHKTRAHEISDVVLRYDVQSTVYNGAVSFWSAENNEFGRKIGADEDDLARLKEDPLHLYRKITFQHHYLQTGYVKEGEKRIIKIIDAPKKDDAQFINFENSAIKIEDRLRTGEFLPNYGNHCDRCIFKERCDDDSRKNIATYIPQQLEFFRQAKKIAPVRERTVGQMKFKFPDSEKVKKEVEKQLEMFR